VHDRRKPFQHNTGAIRVNLQQLKVFRETIRCKFNVTEAANAVFASQSGISKQIRDLEEELGVALFNRRGKRLLGLTEPGKQVIKIADRMLLEAENIKQVASQFAEVTSGTLQIATTHTQARYVLPSIILKFKDAFPDVRLAITQAGPKEILSLLVAGDVDVGIATDTLEDSPGVVAFPYYSWRHVVVAPLNHPLVGKDNVTLEDLVAFPIVTYDQGVTGRSRIDAAFDASELSPDIIMTALDADVIKAYVELGLGIGIIAPMAFDAARDGGLRALNATDLFAPSTTSIAVRRGRFHRNYVYRFMGLCSPVISRDAVLDAELLAEPVDEF
jgi:LysR family cys regulon transcriptional activator